MSKTVKKRRNGSKSDTIKSFIVTESGLVETEEKTTSTKRESVQRSTERKESVASFVHDKQERKGSHDFGLEISESKLKAKNVLLKASQEKKQFDDDAIRETIRNNSTEGVDEIKASLYNKNVESMMEYFMVSKALAIMGTERRKRQEREVNLSHANIKIIYFHMQSLVPEGAEEVEEVWEGSKREKLVELIHIF